MNRPLLAVTVAFERTSPRQVAATVAGAIVGRVLRPHAEVELAVHEAVTNALLHGGPPVEVSAVVAHDAVEVRVVDGGGRPPKLSRPAEERGRGALLIAASCDQVVVEPLATGGRCVRLRFTRPSQDGATTLTPGPSRLG